MPGIEKPTRLRLWGFLLTVGGGAAVAVGALLPWVSVGLRSDRNGVLTSTSRGVDFRSGKLCLALGVAAILALVVLRVVRSANARRLIAIGVVMAGLGGIALGIREEAIRDRLLFSPTHRIAENLHRALGLPLSPALLVKVRAELEREGTVDLGPGPPLVIAGGVVVVVGGLLDLAWVGERPRGAPPLPDGPGVEVA